MHIAPLHSLPAGLNSFLRGKRRGIYCQNLLESHYGFTLRACVGDCTAAYHHPVWLLSGARGGSSLLSLYLNCVWLLWMWLGLEWH